MSDLTPAEHAAAEALARDFNINHGDGIQRLRPDDFESEARAVVAAARPLIAEEALREASAYLLEHRRDNDGAYDFWRMYEAGGPEWLVSRAVAARPSTSEETNR
ncbi:hypothetical protein [Glycomyces sp. NPDC048151]|uniref:hypothetical protein n=1 Tax=Glycomyces sp. NPDC048151 TaxID=3364002 RepID=UPI00371E552B